MVFKPLSLKNTQGTIFNWTKTTSLSHFIWFRCVWRGSEAYCKAWTKSRAKSWIDSSGRRVSCSSTRWLALDWYMCALVTALEWPPYNSPSCLQQYQEHSLFCFSFSGVLPSCGLSTEGHDTFSFCFCFPTTAGVQLQITHLRCISKVLKTRFDPCHNSMQNVWDLNTATPDWSDENIISWP